jgi:formylglycine-generating enzyme required for sulfatase activity
MAESTHRNYETPSILSDAPLSDEEAAHFHFDQFAVTLARLIADQETQTPLAIGISGAWGSGKTTLLRRVKRLLDQTPRLLQRQKPALFEFANDQETPEARYRLCRTVWFNAWKYAGEEALLVALIRSIVQSMAQDHLVDKAMSKLLDPSYPRRDVVNTVLSWFAVKTPAGEIGLNTGEPQPTVFAEKAALLDQFDEAFDRLLAAWVHHRLSRDKIDPKKGVLVVFIDDLDRCLPEKTVQVLEAIKLFLDKPGCVFVLGADVEVVRRAVESWYQNAHLTGQKAEDYLDKIIQLRFDLPPVVSEAMEGFLKSQRVDEAMLAQWQTLIAAAEVNPRRVKAVLNAIELQWRMLVNSGQAEGVQQGDFIRWSALLRAAPPNFRAKLFDLDDLELRRKFVQEALRWAAGEGEESLARTFQEYEPDGRRLKRVLRQIGSFGEGFDAQTLDAFMHLAAPPAKALPAVEPIKAEAGREPAQPRREETGPVEKGAQPGAESRDRRTWAGMEFVRVPAGRFLMGSKEDNPLAGDDEKPQHALELPELWIGRTPVTNAQFEEFVQATGYQTLAEQKKSGSNWRQPRGQGRGLEGKADHPVVQVSWQDAKAYCDWLSQAFPAELPPGGRFRLPTEAEWEKAARGEFANEWPWGEQAPDPSRCNIVESKIGDTTPVGSYSPQGDSPYGAADMAGNVWEWTGSLYKPYPYDPSDGREDERGAGSRVVRGGSWDYYRYLARCASRYWNEPASFYDDLGFRLVRPH